MTEIPIKEGPPPARKLEATEDQSQLSAEMRQALDDYWTAKTHAEEHWAYVRYLRAGGDPAFGETAEDAERVKNCPCCPAPKAIKVRGIMPVLPNTPAWRAVWDALHELQEGDIPDVPLSERGFGT